MDNFNNAPQHNDSGAIEDAARKKRIQQLKLEMLKTTEPDKLAKLQEMLVQEDKRKLQRKKANNFQSLPLFL